MGPKIDLSQWQNELRQWVKDGKEQEEIRAELLNQGIKVGRTALVNKLAELGIRARRPKIRDTPTLRARIAVLFYQVRLKDEQLVRILEYDGFSIGLKRLRTIRTDMGLRKQIQRGQAEAVEQQIRKVLKEELDQGNVEDYGRKHLYTYMRQKYNLIGRYALVYNSLSARHYSIFRYFLAY